MAEPPKQKAVVSTKSLDMEKPSGIILPVFKKEESAQRHTRTYEKDQLGTQRRKVVFWKRANDDHKIVVTFDIDRAYVCDFIKGVALVPDCVADYLQSNIPHMRVD